MIGVELLCLVSLLGGALALAGILVWAVSSSRRAAIRRLAEALKDGRVTGPGSFAALADGRAFRFTQRGSIQTLAVQVNDAAAELEVRALSGLEELTRWLGLSAAPRDEAEAELSVGKGLEEVARLYHHRAARQALLDLLRAQNDPLVTLRDGWLTLRHTSTDLSLLALSDGARRLCELARLYERREVPLRIAGLARSFVWTGGGAAARCPYCRDDLERAGEEPAGCPTCGTLHHRPCWEEGGGCTVFGCPGRAPAPRGPERLRG